MICPNCKNNIADGSQVCPYCGIPIYNVPTTGPQQPVQQAPYQQPAYQQPAYQQPYQQPMSYTTGNAPKKGGTTAFVYSLIFFIMAIGKFSLFTFIKGWNWESAFIINFFIDVVLAFCLIMIPFAVKNKTLKIISFIMMGLLIPLFIITSILFTAHAVD